jgi:hypothetical protein
VKLAGFTDAASKETQPEELVIRYAKTDTETMASTSV